MAKIDLVGKKFVKTTAVEVLDITDKQVLLQDENKTHKTYLISREDFEEDYKLNENTKKETK